MQMSQRAPRQWQVRFSNENACPGSTARTGIRLTRRQLTARAASPGESPTDVRFGVKSRHVQRKRSCSLCANTGRVPPSPPSPANRLHASGIRSGAGQGVRPHVPLVRARSLDPVEVHEHVADGSLHVTVPESAQDFFCPRNDGQLRCDVLEKFPSEPSRHEAGDVEDRLQLLVGERARRHGLGG